MNRLSVLLAVSVIALAGCSSNNDNPISASATPPDKHTFTAQLLPANEVPPVTNAEAGGSGTVTITIWIAKNANGDATGASIDFEAAFSGFPPGTSLTGAHIHPGGAGTTGGVFVSTTITSGEVTMPAGSGTLSKPNLYLPIDQANAIIANPGGYYFNIHTALNPGGVARGQLTGS